MLARFQFDPVTADDFGVRHEADLKIDIRLVGSVRVVGVGEVFDRDLAAIEQSLGRCNQPWVSEDDFDEGDLLLGLDQIKVG